MNIYGLCFSFLLPGLALGWVACAASKKSSRKALEPKREADTKKKLYIHDLSKDNPNRSEVVGPELFVMRPRSSSRVLDYKAI